MSDKNNAVIISGKISEFYAETVTNGMADKNKLMSGLKDRLVADGKETMLFLSVLRDNVDKFQMRESLYCIFSLWHAIINRQREVSFGEIQLMIQCLFNIAERFCIFETEYEWGNIKFNVYFDLVDSIYNKLCSKISSLRPSEKVPNIKREIKLLYQILCFAPPKSDGEGFRLESFLNFIERNWKAHIDINPKLPILDQDDIHFISNTLCCVIMKSRNNEKQKCIK